MPEKTEHAHGTFSWVDLMTTDQSAAKSFYTSLFGWDVREEAIPQGGTYSMFTMRGKAVAAASTLPEEHAKHGVPPMWNSYITVEDVDRVTKAVEGAGGRVLAEPFDVLTSGRMSVIMDPTGGAVSLWQARDHIGAEITAEDNAFSWNELMTSDPDAAKAFFADLLGWTYDEMESSSGTYTVIKNGDVMNGGMMKPPADGMPTFWAVYFTVPDTDATIAKATELGGSVMMPAADFPGVGRVAWLQDPQGATFAVIQPEAPSA